MRQIGPYQIVEELGRGAMGVVYRAVDPAIDRQVAIKIIRSHEFDSPEEITEAGVRLTREANAVGRLSHPNIVALYQYGKEEDFEYIAMEFVPGSSLSQLLKGGRRFEPAEVVEIVRQVAAALDHAHENGVVHRDIKPANILARPDGVVKVTDFGIARISTQTITREGAAMGTPAYMAPEQIQGSKVDSQADQFSLAVVAYQLFAGRLPFTASSDMALMLQIMNAEPIPLYEANPELPPQADRVLRRALSKDPEKRFSSCGEFAGALDSAFTTPEAFDPEATVRSLPPLPSPPKRKGKRIAVVAMLAVCCCAAFAVVYWNAGKSSPAPPPENKTADIRPVIESRDPIVNPKDDLPYVWIPPGAFVMGCSEGDIDCDPPHAVTIANGFWLGQTEVTQTAYRRVKHGNPSYFKGDRLPVESVSWDDANDYCQAIGGRLPTEAEWEYAARANSVTPPRELNAIGWFRDNSGNTTHPVGQKHPNAFRLYDMLGNVWEWVGDSKVTRGVSWSNGLQYARISWRRPSVQPTSPAVGFRCVANLR